MGIGAGQTIVEVFDHYDVKITLDESNSHIKETITIMNVIDKPIVPGYVYANLKTTSQSKLLGIPVSGIKERPIDVSNIIVTFDGNRINDVQVSQTNETTTIRYGVWFPISPGEGRTIVVEYDSPDFIDKGILFNQGYYPMAANIPINYAQVTLEVADGKHVTYSNAKANKSNGLISWSEESLGTEQWLLKYEVSSIPLPLSPVRWSFTLLIIILGLVSIWSYRHWKPKKD